MSTELALKPPAELTSTTETIADYLSAESRAIVLETDEDLQLASDVVNDIKARVQALEAVREAVSLPISQGLERYNALFRPLKRAADSARALWDGKVRDLLARRAEAQRAAEEALQEAIQAQDAPRAMEAIQAFQPPARAQGLAIQEAWDFEEVDHAAVPPQLMVVDRQAVLTEIRKQVTRLAALGYAEAPTIPGLRLFKRPILRATRRG